MRAERPVTLRLGSVTRTNFKDRSFRLETEYAVFFLSCYQFFSSFRVCTSRARMTRVPSVMPADSLAGANLWPCCFAMWPTPARCARFAVGLAACEGKLQHLGIPKAPNEVHAGLCQRASSLCSCMKKVFGVLYARCQQTGRFAAPRFRFSQSPAKASMARSSIYAPACSTGRTSSAPKGAAKLHLVLDHDGHLPCYAVITEGKSLRGKNRAAMAVSSLAPSWSLTAATWTINGINGSPSKRCSS